MYTDKQGYGDELEPIDNSSVLIQDVAWKTCQGQWTIETSGGRGPGTSMLAECHDDEAPWKKISDDIGIHLIWTNV